MKKKDVEMMNTALRSKKSAHVIAYKNNEVVETTVRDLMAFLKDEDPDTIICRTFDIPDDGGAMHSAIKRMSSVQDAKYIDVNGDVQVGSVISFC